MLAERIRMLRKERTLTQADLAKRFGITQQAIAKWESGRSFPEPAMIAQLAEFFGTTTDHLLGIDNPPSGVKIIGTVKAGYNALADEDDMGKAPANVKNSEGYRYLIVKGDSMEPYIREGDLALVRLQKTLHNGDLGVVIYGDGEATLKKYYERDGVVMLEPFNDAYETLTVKGHDLESLIVFGKVVETSTKW